MVHHRAGLLQQQLYIHQKLKQNVNEQHSLQGDSSINGNFVNYDLNQFAGIGSSSSNNLARLREGSDKNTFDLQTPPSDLMPEQLMQAMNQFNFKRPSGASPGNNIQSAGPITVNYTKDRMAVSVDEDSNNQVMTQFICSNASSPHIGSPNNESMASLTSADTFGTMTNSSQQASQHISPNQHHPANMLNKPRMYSAIMGSMENSFTSSFLHKTNSQYVVPHQVGPLHPHRHENLPHVYIPPQHPNLATSDQEMAEKTTPTQDNTTATDPDALIDVVKEPEKGLKKRKKKKYTVRIKEDRRDVAERLVEQPKHDRSKMKHAVNEFFRPSSDACTPRLEKDITYKPAPERNHKAMSNTMGTISRPNFRDALRRVAMIIRQHVVKIEQRFQNTSTKKSLFRQSMRDLFQEDNFLTPLYKCTMVRVPMARPGVVYAMKKKITKHTIPSETEIYDFAHQLFKSVQLSSECSIVCLIYVERLMESAKVPLMASTWRPIFMCGLLLASKVWQDLSSWNIEFATVYPQYSLDSINKLEVLFLKQIKWDLYIFSR